MDSPRPEDPLVPGETQEAHVRGIGMHAYSKHGVKGTPKQTRSQFQEAARNDLNTADLAFTLNQKNGVNVIYGNTKSGFAGYLNTADPLRSTRFTPPNKSVDRFVKDAVEARRLLGERPKAIDLITVRKLGPSVTQTSRSSHSVGSSSKPIPPKASPPKASPPKASPPKASVSMRGTPPKAPSPKPILPQAGPPPSVRPPVPPPRHTVVKQPPDKAVPTPPDGRGR